MKASLTRILATIVTLVAVAGCQSSNMGLAKLGWKWPSWQWGKKDTAVASNAPTSPYTNPGLPSQMADPAAAPGYGYTAAAGYQNQTQAPGYGYTAASTGQYGQYGGPTNYGQQAPYSGAYANNAAGAGYGQPAQTIAQTGPYATGSAYDTQAAAGSYGSQSGYNTGGYGQASMNSYAQPSATTAATATGAYPTTTPQANYDYTASRNAAAGYTSGPSQTAGSQYQGSSYNSAAESTATGSYNGTAAGNYTGAGYRTEQQTAATTPASQFKQEPPSGTYQPGNTGYNPPGVPAYNSPYNAAPYTRTTPSSNYQGGEYRPGGTSDYVPGASGTGPTSAGGIQPAGYDQSNTQGGYGGYQPTQHPSNAGQSGSYN